MRFVYEPYHCYDVRGKIPGLFPKKECAPSQCFRTLRLSGLLGSWKGAGLTGFKLLKDYKELAGAITQFLWNRCRPNMPNDPKKQVRVVPVLLGRVVVPPDVDEVPKRGPKFSLKVSLNKHKLLASAHRIADKLQGEE
ncbi:hypothetical protein HPB52_015632 [Rhipicephalus sanguineus]|uniref:Uncharacterized protein n=1 Tax=Rhipicephalus sanguineus TaxID=34632 RepID=A0A9D4PMJ0_RHISA|nr:hypothetical protein HPB52_015632 [Rhipicephalus sanguineus]